MPNVTYDEIKVVAKNGYRNENGLPLGWVSADSDANIAPLNSIFKEYIYSKLQSEFGIQNPAVFLLDHVNSLQVFRHFLGLKMDLFCLRWEHPFPLNFINTV